MGLIIRLSASLPNTPEARVIRNQITKSGTSIGANYREANRARSKADFKNKIKICESEASETQYWLEMISELNFETLEDIKSVNETPRSKLRGISTKDISNNNAASSEVFTLRENKECSELLAIFCTIAKGS